MLQALVRAGKRTRPADEGFVLSSYIEATLISSTVAELGGVIRGIQILGRAGPYDPFGVPEGDGSVGTHVHPDAAGQGIGRALLTRTLSAARDRGLVRITAAIAADNAEGLGYYGAMGFKTEREEANRIYKVLHLSQP